MDLRTSWRWAFEMVDLDRMARVTHNGAESGHQLPLEDGASAPPSSSRWNVFGVRWRPDRSGCHHACHHARTRGQHAHAMQQQLHACMVMHAWYSSTDIHTEIQLYRPRVHRADVCEALYCVFGCPSRVVYFLQIPKKRAEAQLKQLEFALSTGHLGPKLPKWQLIPVSPEAAKPDLVLDDRPMVQTNRVDVLS